MIDFPNSPIPGQVFNSGTGPIYIWDGVAWNLATPQTKTARPENIFVNPCCYVSQENGGNVGTIAGYYAADQWLSQFVMSGAAMAFNAFSGPVNPSGSINRLLYKVTTAKASLASGDFGGISQRIEGVRAYNLGWHGGGNPVPAVLRFGFNGPAGTYSAAIRNAAATHSFTATFTITAPQAGTDTIQVIPVPPPPSGSVWASGAVMMFELYITLACAANLIPAANGWSAGTFIAGPGQTNLFATVNNQVVLFDFGLYADPDKTGLPPLFRVPDFDDDLFDSQRYWEPCPGGLYGTASGSATSYMNWFFKVSKRTTPSIAGSLYPGSAVNYVDTNRLQVTNTGATGNPGISSAVANARM